MHIGILKYDTTGSQLWEVDTSFGVGGTDVRVVGFQLDSINNLCIEANYLGGITALPYATYRYNSNGVGGPIVDNPTGDINSLASGFNLQLIRMIILS